MLSAIAGMGLVVGGIAYWLHPLTCSIIIAASFFSVPRVRRYLGNRAWKQEPANRLYVYVDVDEEEVAAESACRAEVVVDEYDELGVLQRKFVHGPGYDEVLVMDRNTGGGATATGPGDERYYYTRDALGSTVALVSASTGKAVEGYLYEPYGATYVVEAGANGQVDWGGDDTIASYSGLDNPYTFTGQRFDAETGLMYYKARYYSSEQGRFISRDPIGI
jgi:RHS repeat-associated protein